MLSFEEIMKGVSEESNSGPTQEINAEPSSALSFEDIMAGVSADTPVEQAPEPVTSPAPLSFEDIMAGVSDGPQMTEFSQPSDPEPELIESAEQSLPDPFRTEFEYITPEPVIDKETGLPAPTRDLEEIKSQSLNTPYEDTNVMYDFYINELESTETAMSDEKLLATEKNLAAMFVANVYVDATSAMAGGRKYDDLAAKSEATPGTPEYRSGLGRVGRSVSEGQVLVDLNPLVDREDYAKFAVNRLIKQLHESGAPPSLMTQIVNEYEKTKDDFDDLSDMDVFVTSEALKNRTAKTYSQLLSLPLNVLITPVAFAVAGAAGRTRNPGEPNDNLKYLAEATNIDVENYDTQNNVSRIQAAQRIANRSYVPDPVGGDAIKLQTSDVLYIMQPKVIGSWQEGLKKHIDAKVKELPPLSSTLHPSREKSERLQRDPKRIYEFLKSFGALSYSDAMDSWAGEFLKGYPPIKPPKNGWTWQAASRAASGKTAEQLKAKGVIASREPTGKVYEKGETPPFWEFLGESLGSITAADVVRSATTPMDATPVALSALLDRADSLPEEATRINKERLKRQIEAGVFGEGPKGNPEATMAIIERGSMSSARYGTQLKEFSRNMLTMMGPEETAKAMVMAIGGFKKYGLPSLLPGAEVGGMLSGDDLAVFGDDDILPLMKELGLTEKDVELFWKDNPGFAAAMIPGATNPLGRVLGAVTRGAGATVRAINRVSKDTKMTGRQKLKALASAAHFEFSALTDELIMAETTRTAGRAKKERIVSIEDDAAIPVEQTATSLRSQAAEAKKMADRTDLDEATKKTYQEVSDGLESAAQALDEAGRVQEMEMIAEGGGRRILDDITPTSEAVADLPRAPGYQKQAPSPAVQARKGEMAALIKNDEASIKSNAANKDYKSPGQRGLRKALKDIAGPLGFKRVNDRFRAEHMNSPDQIRSIARQMSENGVTDPRVYRQLLPDAALDGANGIAELVFKAENSKAAKAKAKFRRAMQDVADLRKVDIEEVYNETYTFSVADDMVRNGVTDPNVYALLGLDDNAVRARVKQADNFAAKPVTKTKKFAIPVKDQVEVKPPLTAKRFVGDMPYGVTRAIAGKKPANILSNRLNQVKGKGASGALPMLEAGMLATAEFMKSPFAFVNFPAWMGDFAHYMYTNSTGKSAAQRRIRGFFNASISPSKKLGAEIYNYVTHSEGKKKINEFELQALAKRFDDETEQSARNFIQEAMEEVALDQHSPGQLDIRLTPKNTLSQEQKNNMAIALLNMGDDGYIEIPSKTPDGGPQKIYLGDMFTIEYKKNGQWTDAFAAGDEMAALKQSKKELASRRTQANKRQQEIDSEQIARAEGPDPRLVTESAQIKSSREAIAKQIDEINAKMEEISERFGSAEDVFQVVDGRVTGVQDIRFNLKDTYDGPIGDLEKTLLGMANGYVRPMQLRIMEMGANLAVGENAFRLSIEAAKPKNSVSILDLTPGGTQKRRHIKTFKGKDAPEKAAALAQKINEEMAAKGNDFELAESVTEGVSRGKTVVTGKRDLEVNGYDAVANTADYMSAYFTETAFLDSIHDTVKRFNDGELTGGQYAKQNQIIADMLVKLYPKKVIKKLRKKHGKKGENLSNTQLAVLIVDGLEKGTIPKVSAKGSGRFVRERIWQKNLTFDQRKDFYAMYTYATETAHNQLIKRTEHYRMLNMFREKGLILTRQEIEATPGLSVESNQFMSMKDVKAQFPGLFDDIDGAYIATDVVEGLVQQQNLVNGITSYGPYQVTLAGDSFLSQTNRQLKRGAVVSALNGTMVRNASGGIAVQAQMADIPATMRFTLQAAKANRDILNGATPRDPLFKDLSQRLGGPGRATIELGARQKKATISKSKTAQAEYLFKVLSGDDDAPPLGSAIAKQTEKGQKTMIDGVARAMDPERKASRNLGDSLALESSPEAVPPGRQAARATRAETATNIFSEISETATSIYGSIDDVLRLAYAYELVKKHNISPSEAAAAARKVFYDYPDIPPAAQALRDAPLLGLPFIGYQLWSTKAFGRYYEKNPLKAAVLGGWVNALTESTERTLKLSSMYDANLFEGVAAQDVKSEFPLPMMVSERTTQAERSRLVAAGVPQEQAKYKIGQVALNQGPLSVGLQTDINLLSPAIKASQNNDIGVVESAALVGASFRGMVGNVFEKGVKSARTPTKKQKRLEAEQARNIPVEEGGGFVGEIFSDVLEGTLEILGIGLSDARGIAKGVSAVTGRPYAGQDKAVIDTFTNAIGLAMKVTDPRLVKENFNNIGQAKIKNFQDALEGLILQEKDVIEKRGLSYYLAKKELFQKALRDFERANDIFKKDKGRDGLKIKNGIVTLMRAMLKYEPDSPQFMDSYLTLMDYFMLSKE